jgi:hypothetical protein
MRADHGRKRTKGLGPLGIEEATTTALLALAFLAEEPERLGRFLALTGLGPAELKAQAGSPATLAAVLEHLLGDESLLFVFAASKGVAPELIAPAHAILAGDRTRGGTP